MWIPHLGLPEGAKEAWSVASGWRDRSPLDERQHKQPRDTGSYPSSGRPEAKSPTLVHVWIDEFTMVYLTRWFSSELPEVGWLEIDDEQILTRRRSPLDSASLALV